jgi:hypothetical protein
MVIRRKLEPQLVDAVPDEQVDEIYSTWFETCMPDEVKEAWSDSASVTQHKLQARLLIAQWGIEVARKAVAALPISPEHNGSRRKAPDGGRLLRQDLTTARIEAPDLADFWDNRK